MSIPQLSFSLLLKFFQQIKCFSKRFFSEQLLIQLEHASSVMVTWVEVVVFLALLSPSGPHTTTSAPTAGELSGMNTIPFTPLVVVMVAVTVVVARHLLASSMKAISPSLCLSHSLTRANLAHATSALYLIPQLPQVALLGVLSLLNMVVWELQAGQVPRDARLHR